MLENTSGPSCSCSSNWSPGASISLTISFPHNCPILTAPSTAPLPLAPPQVPFHPLSCFLPYTAPSPQRSFLPSARHTPHNADPFLPRPTVGSHQLRSCPTRVALLSPRLHARVAMATRGRVSKWQVCGTCGHCAGALALRAPPHESLSRVDLRLEGRGPRVSTATKSGGSEGAGYGSGLDLKTKLEGLGLKTMRHHPAGRGKDGAPKRPTPAPRCMGSGLARVQQVALGVSPARLVRLLESSPGFPGSHGCSWVQGKNRGWSTPALLLLPLLSPDWGLGLLGGTGRGKRVKSGTGIFFFFLNLRIGF